MSELLIEPEKPNKTKSNLLDYTFGDWTQNQKIAFRIAFIFFGLFAIPWDTGFYTFIYNIDYPHMNYRELTDLVAFFNPQWLNIFSEGGFFGWESYINIPLVLLIAIAGCVVWTVLDKKSKEYNWLYYWVRVACRYRVAYAAIAWGYKKLFIMQMPSGNQGLYNTDFIDFFAKRLYWEGIGVAPHYEVFLGFAEFIGGFLLLFRRTTAVGAAITFIVFGNIAIANHAYDIGEHVPSAGLAMISLFILWYDLPGIWELLVKQVNTQVIHYYPVFNITWQKYLRLSVKWFFNFVFVILFFVFEVYGFTHNDFYKIPNTPGLKDSEGYYEVTQFKLNNKEIPYSPFDKKRWQDAAFEKWSSLSFVVYDRPQQIEMFAAGSYPRNNEKYDDKLHFDWRGDTRRFGSGKKQKYDASKRDLSITWELSGLAGRQYYYYKADTVKHILYLQNKNRSNKDQKQVLHYERPNASRIVLWGTNEFKDSIYVVLDKSKKQYLVNQSRDKPLTYIPY